MRSNASVAVAAEKMSKAEIVAARRRASAALAAPRAAGPLDKRGNKVGQGDLKRVLRAAAASVLIGEAVESCGHRVGFGWEARGQKVGVLQKGKHGHFWSGVQSCGSVWVCPVCAAKVARIRAIAVAESVAKFQGAGGYVGMQTLTIAHQRGDDLEALLEAVKDIWTELKRHRRWKDAKKAGLICGGVTGTEVTHGNAHGWHPHLHVLLYLAKGIRLEEACDLLMWIENAWCEAARRKGFDASPSGQHFRFATTGKAAGDYVTKFGVEWEITHGHMKAAGNGSRTPWDLLKAIAAGTAGGAEAASLFREYAKAFKGRRQLVPFGCVREEGLLASKDEDEANAEEGVGEVVAVFTMDQVREIARRRLEKRIEDAADLSGFMGVWSLMSNEGLGTPWRADVVSRVRATRSPGAEKET